MARERRSELSGYRLAMALVIPVLVLIGMEATRVFAGSRWAAGLGIVILIPVVIRLAIIQRRRS